MNWIGSVFAFGHDGHLYVWLEMLNDLVDPSNGSVAYPAQKEVLTFQISGVIRDIKVGAATAQCISETGICIPPRELISLIPFDNLLEVCESLFLDGGSPGLELTRELLSCSIHVNEI
ncbi:hypothetical protein C8J56DRAFT_887897 [Mycena floridula]|nr:hypothetical protein C8J56DRAFT_887897 [Mycena floridula]